MSILDIPNIEILLDEIRQAANKAETAGFLSYSHGYENGLRMALNILEGSIA